MGPISYAAAPVPVRADLAAAHQRFWERLARPGCWWTGSERVAIAAEVRRAPACALCRRRRAALSPAEASGDHDSAGVLPDAAVEVIHRVATDPARLSRGWFEKVQAAGLSDGHYVEILGILVALVSIDGFCRGLGVPLHALPDPEPGEPSHYRPATAVREGAWVPMIPNGRAIGAERGLYGTLGRTGNVLRAMSLVPDAVRDLLRLGAAHYLPEDRMVDLGAGRAIDRTQIELVAGRVSALRECFY